ncbi:DUF4283 domain protein, partial [Trifolium medium]|nr:DUF4283 domain protein [Trifolium medium]
RDDPPSLHRNPSSDLLVDHRHTSPCDGRSFAEVLTQRERNMPGVYTLHEPPPPPAVQTVVVDIQSERLDFLAKSLVGYTKTDVELLTFLDSLVLHGLHNVSVRPMGGGLVLISSNVDDLLLSLFDPAQEWWGAWFSKLEPWTPDIIPYRREVWLSVWGVPVHCWGVYFFEKIAKSFGDFIMLDDITLKETNFIKGRVKVSLPVTATGVDEVVSVVTCSGSFPVRVMEEVGWFKEDMMCYRDIIPCEGDGSDTSVARSYRIPSEDVFSDAENFENGEEEGQHCLVDLQGRDKSPLSTLGGLPC